MAESHGFFLRGAGVPEVFIEFMHSLVGTAFEFYSCFISYSSTDEDFAKQLHGDLQSNGVRCWFAPKDLPIGSDIRSGIDCGIHSCDKLLVVLSHNSVGSPWVGKEVATAFEKENRENTTVLFPIRLDDDIMNIQTGWAADIRRMRNIGDFRDWKIASTYKEAFERLLRNLMPEGRSHSQHG